MNISETKLWIIQKIIETDDLDLLQQIADILSLASKTKEHKYMGNTALKIVKEPNMVEEYAVAEKDPYPLTPEQEERLMKELDEAEEDIKAGRVISHEEMKIYIDSLFKSSGAKKDSLD